MTPAIALFILGAILIRAGWKNQGIRDAVLGTDDTLPTGNVPTLQSAGSPTTPGVGGNLASGDLPHGGGGTTPKDIIDQIVVPLARSHGIMVTAATVEAANHRHSPMTLSGNVSDHNGPPEVRWAADMPTGTGKPTTQADALARDLAARFDIPWSGSGAKSATHGGFRYQLLYRTLVGGNHFNHVHFGVRKA